MVAWELEGSALMTGYIPTCFPLLGNGPVPYIFHTYRKGGSHACFVGKCISIAKDSSSYLLSAPRPLPHTVHTFLIVIHSPSPVLDSFEKLETLVLNCPMLN